MLYVCHLSRIFRSCSLNEVLINFWDININCGVFLSFVQTIILYPLVMIICELNVFLSFINMSNVCLTTPCWVLTWVFKLKTQALMFSCVFFLSHILFSKICSLFSISGVLILLLGFITTLHPPFLQTMWESSHPNFSLWVSTVCHVSWHLKKQPLVYLEHQHSIVF